MPFEMFYLILEYLYNRTAMVETNIGGEFGEQQLLHDVFQSHINQL